MTENGMQPLSLRMKRASYMGTLTNTINPQRIIWHIKFPRAPKSRKMMSMNPPIKLKRLSIASVATIVNMTDELPNSIISCSYLSITSSVTTLVVMANAVWDSPICLTIQSTNPKKNAVVLRMISILCKFHQDLSLWPQLSASHMLYAFWATKTYANGMNHRLDTCDTMIKALKLPIFNEGLNKIAWKLNLIDFEKWNNCLSHPNGFYREINFLMLKVWVVTNLKGVNVPLEIRKCHGASKEEEQ